MTTDQNDQEISKRDQLAQETAEYIKNELTPKTEAFHSHPDVTVHYADDKRPPTSLEEIKTHLLGGGCWISWLDDRVIDAMRQLHGDPTGDASLFTYTDTDAVNDGALVDLFDLGIKVYMADKPITRMSTALFDALHELNPGGSPAEQSAAYTAMLGLIAKGARDTAHDDEPKGELYASPVPLVVRHHAHDDNSTEIILPADNVWFVPNTTTEYAGVPGSDGGWTVMFPSDR